MQTKRYVIILSMVIFGSSGAAMAGVDSVEVQGLAKEVAALNDEVERLKQMVESLQALQPTITSLMPDFAERFHVMHYAGEAEDWEIATHELFELKRLIEVMQRVDLEIGAMVNGFLLGNFNKLDAAIEHKNVESFDKALVETVENCNACHAAAGSPFMKVSLDVRDGLSMRHPHDLNKSTISGKRTHMH